MSKSKPKQQTVVNQPWAPAQGALQNILNYAGGMFAQGTGMQQGGGTQQGAAVPTAGPQAMAPYAQLHPYDPVYSNIRGDAGLLPAMAPAAQPQGAPGMPSQDAPMAPLAYPSTPDLPSLSTVDGSMINPYLSQMFNAAADPVVDRINSQFGLSGRGGSPGHQGVMTRALGNLSANIYGNAYDRERALQYQNLLGQHQIDTQNLMQASPYQQLQNYLGIVQPIGAMGSMSQQPLYNNTGAGLLGGAAAGAGLAGALTEGGLSSLGFAGAAPWMLGGALLGGLL